MSHHIYHTEAIVLGSRAAGEGSRFLYCYTRDLGLVSVHAQSIRESRSRLRYALQNFSHASVDLIRGKHAWKLISATPISSFRHLWANESRRRIIANQSELALRLIQGEESHELIFDDLLRGFHFLSSLSDGAALMDAELLLVMKLLRRLGYWGSSDYHDLLAGEESYCEDGLATIRAKRSDIILLVNESLRSSQL